MIETARLILRGWRADDAVSHHAMCSDSQVHRFLGPPPSLADSYDVVSHQQALLARLGYCFWALERRADAHFLGWCGVKPGPAGTPIADLPEIGWSLPHAAWGQGYATEAARVVLEWFWTHTREIEVAAITVPANTRSWGLMERLGMHRVIGGDFDHPDVPDGSPLKRHILYRIDRPSTGSGT